MEGRHGKADRMELTECWRTTWKTPYIMRLALSAGLGGLLFGYDTGVISGALLYIKEDFQEVNKMTRLQETIVSMAVTGAIFGAAIGGWINDRYGRKKSILLADIVFFVGAIVMAAAPAPWVIIVGRILVGLGVGMASMTHLFISRKLFLPELGALSSAPMACLLRAASSWPTSSTSPSLMGTWRWMLGIAGLPAILQFILMLSLPESPRWLYRRGKVDEARSILEKIYPPNEVEDEMQALHESIEAEKADTRATRESIVAKVKGAFSNQVVRRGLYAGITVQVAQHFVGINTIMYYSPTIVQFAGFASNKTALALLLITSGLNAIGSIVSMCFVDRYGRRRLMIISMFGIITCLVVLSAVFWQASLHAPAISQIKSTHFGTNLTCPVYAPVPSTSSWNCITCLKAKCAFCADGTNQYHQGACLASTTNIWGLCREEGRTRFQNGCPSRFGFLAVVLLGLYIISYSPGMGTMPWLVNSEIYPLRYRGLGGGIATVSNWCSNLIVSETFLTLTQALGSGGTFLLFAGFSLIGLIFIYFLVPETKGLRFVEVEKMLEDGYRPKFFRRKEADSSTKVVV
ncbi:hypothetical protein MLD38_019443 [Melastoma candidum]|uniref:Uncharacterized protein n=1 Tax=Melastoma candidum TaxID=119954 RepID=A0ACB9QYB1_9MYRT|nr:hypothetical protein MLD38_019443 [Melastoma candidum]